jgi:hypothetical protein
MIVNEISLVIQNKNDIRKLMADKKTKESSKEDYKSSTVNQESVIARQAQDITSCSNLSSNAVKRRMIHLPAAPDS